MGAGAEPAGRMTERGGGAEGQTGRGLGAGRRGSPGDFSRGPFPRAADEAGPPVWLKKGGRSLRGSFLIGEPSAGSGKGLPFGQGGSTGAGGVERAEGLLCCKTSC